MQPVQHAQSDFHDAVRMSHGPGQGRYIADDIAQLRRIAAEVRRHHEEMWALHAGLTLANDVMDRDGRRATARYDAALAASLECDMQDGLTAEAAALVRAEVEALFNDDAHRAAA